ncbi:MAG: leucyl aminopeptidase [Egibacteraceae bacterium]
MLSVIAAASDPLQVDADLLAVPVFKGGIEGPGAGPVLDALGLDDFPVTPCFRGDIGQHFLLASPGLSAAGVLLVGLGRMDATDPERLRHAAGVAAQACRRVERVATTLAGVHANRAAVEAITEGFHLGAYTDRRFKAAADGAEVPRLAEVTLLVPSSLLGDARAGIARATVYARATCAARDLVNLPPDRKRPEDLVAAIRRLVAGVCDVTVRDEDALAGQGFGGLLAVGRGSSAPPRLVELRYRPPAPIAHVVLVGKGITFDAGGLSLRRGTDLETQKKDMAGAAVVAAAMSALADLDVRLQVTGLLALAENVPGADAQRPGDVVTIHGGTTVEVRDTDAEGRLVLADALDYATTLRPQTIIDIATLTGTSAALGRYAGALMANDDDLVDELRAAALVAGEHLWPLPLWPELDRFLDTPVADLTNPGDGAGGGTIMGGLFLKRFVGDCPWAHLDITGPAFLSPDLATGHLPPGATGFGVRTLLVWLERRAA